MLDKDLYLFYYAKLVMYIYVDHPSVTFSLSRFVNYREDSIERDRMVVGYITTYAISAYNKRCEFESRSCKVYSIQHYLKKLVSELRQDRLSPGTLVSSTNKTDRNGIAEILLIVLLNTIILTLNYRERYRSCSFC